MNSPLTRRHLLVLVATGVGVGLAGCTDESSQGPDRTSPPRAPVNTPGPATQRESTGESTSPPPEPPPPEPTASESALLLALAQARQLETTAARTRPPSALTRAALRASSTHAALLQSTLSAREPKLLEHLESLDVSQRPGNYRLAQVALDSTRAQSIASACEAEDDHRPGLLSMLAHRRVIAHILDPKLPPLDVSGLEPAEAATLLADLHPVMYAVEMALARTPLSGREGPARALDILDSRREALLVEAGDEAPLARLAYRLTEDGRSASSRRRLNRLAADTWLASAGTLLGKDRQPARQTTAIALVVEAAIVARLVGRPLPTWPGLP